MWWCDVAFSHLEVPLRLTDAERARKARPPQIACVVIDVLRATTTIVSALEHGCSRVLPFSSPEKALEAARRRRSQRGKEFFLLGGEQDSHPIPGFDTGNSPRECTRPVIAGRDLLLSTSNGTKTLTAAGDCGHILIAAFANLSAAAHRASEILKEDPSTTLLLACSGRNGGYCEEDTVAAGLLLQKVIYHLGEGHIELSDTARAALGTAKSAEEDLGRMLRESWWGKHLASLGLGEDIAYCARQDWTEVVPIYRDGTVTAR
ncbi:MAG: 2-phosphosulfolactate phosphatase [bacterium]|nr:2-phosphosulfolactate phosphatase [bacterium]